MMTQTDIAHRIQVSAKTIMRWEQGKSRPRFEDLFAYAATVRADTNDLAYLMTDPSATQDDATQRATRQLEHTTAPAVLTVLTREDNDELRAIIDEIQHDPRLLHYWLGYGRGLLKAKDRS